jgi:hypothetical protein
MADQRCCGTLNNRSTLRNSFCNLVSHPLNYFLRCELSKPVAPNTINNHSNFNTALDLHYNEARYGKTLQKGVRRITRNDVSNSIQLASKKIPAELRHPRDAVG